MAGNTEARRDSLPRAHRARRAAGTALFLLIGSLFSVEAVAAPAQAMPCRAFICCNGTYC